MLKLMLCIKLMSLGRSVKLIYSSLKLSIRAYIWTGKRTYPRCLHIKFPVKLDYGQEEKCHEMGRKKNHDGKNMICKREFFRTESNKKSFTFAHFLHPKSVFFSRDFAQPDALAFANGIFSSSFGYARNKTCNSKTEISALKFFLRTQFL